MSSLRLSLLLASLMTAAAVAGVAGRPPARDTAATPRYVLEDVVPKQFGDWRELPAQDLQVVNPQTQQLLDKLYSQMLARYYVNSRGYHVMLSAVYGDDQRGDLQAHKPEVCYPAQGFTLHSNTQGQLSTPYGDIAIRRLDTSLGSRKEPVTYWFTVGDTAVQNKLQQRMVEIRLGLTGQIPDGLLMRISSLDDSPARAFQAHDAFVADLLAASSAANRARLSGLGTTAP
ncbi:MAG TPA: EpsI family protein [Rhizobacter sp.]|nr:EpsI family protein [Rhizobacter sp.]